MCNPAERKKVRFTSSSLTELIDPARLESIEKSTNAFIRPLENIAQFEISGTELAVTLALSTLEEKAGTAIEDLDMKAMDTLQIDDSAGVITISPVSHNSSARLSDVLQRALSENSDGICSVDDYKNTRPSVQRVLVSCLQNDKTDNIDDDLLFADGPKDSFETSRIKILTDDDDDITGDSVTKKSDSVVKKCGENAEKVNLRNGEALVSVGDKAEKLSLQNTSTLDLNSLTKEQKYLRSFGMNLGYEERIVNRALCFVDEKTRPSDFLDLISSVKSQDQNPSGMKAGAFDDVDKVASDDDGDDVVILETETIEYLDSKDSSPVIRRVQGAGATEEKSSSAVQPIPDGYFAKLMEDFHQEDETCDVEELKRRNAERQRLLRENFDHQGQQALTSCSGEAPGQHGAKKKGKGKRKKKNKQGNANQGENKSVNDLQGNKDSMETRTYSKDDEQTCVLRVWGNERKTDDGDIQDVDDQFQASAPWKKNFKSRDKQQPNKWSHPLNLSNEHQHRSPQQNQGAMAQHWPSPEQQGHQRFSSPNKGKPTLVVTPVNVSLDRQQQQQHVQTAGKDLRYIVIDGSNVAMT